MTDHGKSYEPKSIGAKSSKHYRFEGTERARIAKNEIESILHDPTDPLYDAYRSPTHPLHDKAVRAVTALNEELIEGRGEKIEAVRVNAPSCVEDRSRSHTT